MFATQITNLKRHLAKWEPEHLRRHAAELAERLEKAEENARSGWEAAEMWREDAMQLMQEMMEEGHEIGLTKEGRVGVIASAEEPIDRWPTLLYLTDIQRIALNDLLREHGRRGGSIIAQVWPDGIRAALITDDEHNRIQEILGTNKKRRTFRSAADAQADAEQDQAQATVSA